MVNHFILIYNIMLNVLYGVYYRNTISITKRIVIYSFVQCVFFIPFFVLYLHLGRHWLPSEFVIIIIIIIIYYCC